MYHCLIWITIWIHVGLLTDVTPTSGCELKDCTNADGCTLNDTNDAVCFCNTGYALQADDSCANIDECAQGVCLQQCADSAGSYTCSCYTGYTLAADKVTCIACEFPSYGDQCTNTCACGRGSLRCDPVRGCVCKAGWQGTNCGTDVNECSDANICNDVNKNCVNSLGSYSCVCRSGYTLHENGTCLDIMECTDPALNDCNQVCTNTLGGYTCSCDTGYNIDPQNAKSCVECPEGTYGDDCLQKCSCNATKTASCSNINGTCTCNEGWTGTSCNDNVNECNDPAAHQCPSNSKCHDTPGSFYYQCDTGYSMTADGTCQQCDRTRWGQDCANTCTCVLTNTLTCIPTNGTCTCNTEWSGDTCATDVDECTQTPAKCGAPPKTCTNTNGSYRCGCESGYTINSNSECKDNNECLLGTDTCDQECTNTVGSFNCSCSPGFSGTGNNCTACANGTWGVQCANTCGCLTANSSWCNPATGCVCKTGWTGTTCSRVDFGS